MTVKQQALGRPLRSDDLPPALGKECRGRAGKKPGGKSPLSAAGGMGPARLGSALQPPGAQLGTDGLAVRRSGGPGPSTPLHGPRMPSRGAAHLGRRRDGKTGRKEDNFNLRLFSFLCF